MTTYVQLGEQDNAFDLANVLDRLAGRAQPDEESEEKSALSQLVENGAFARLIDEGVLGSISTVMEASEADVEAVFALTFALFPRLAPADLARITTAFIPHITSSPAPSATPSPLTRLRLLTQLFNLLNAALGTATILPNLPLTAINQQAELGTTTTTTVLLALLRYAVEARLSGELVNSLPMLQQLVAAWDVKPTAVSEFHRLAYETVKQSGGGKGEDEYLYKYLRSLDKLTADDAQLKTSTAYAFTAALRAISSPLSATAVPNSTSQSPAASSPLTPHRLLSLNAIKLLAAGSTPDHANIHRLLCLFATDDVDAYLTFSGQQQDFLSRHKLSHTLLLQKLRILSLCALASSSASSSLPYSAIQSRLSLPATVDVEMAVIDAIVSGRLDARIDQDKETVVVRRVVGSVLKVRPSSGAAGKGAGEVGVEADWAVLERRLGSWKTNISQVLTKISGDAGDGGEEL